MHLLTEVSTILQYVIWVESQYVSQAFAKPYNFKLYKS